MRVVSAIPSFVERYMLGSVPTIVPGTMPLISVLPHLPLWLSTAKNMGARLRSRALATLETLGPVHSGSNCGVPHFTGQAHVCEHSCYRTFPERNMLLFQGLFLMFVSKTH